MLYQEKKKRYFYRMDDLRKKAKEILVSELSKKDLEIWEKLSDREGVRFCDEKQKRQEKPIIS